MNYRIATPPDLLQRFVPTPHTLRFRIEDLWVCLETNDPAIVAAMRTTEAAPSGVADSAFSYLWKIVRDQQARGDGQEITVLSSGALSTVLRGTHTIIAIDRQVGEVLAFIATDVSAEEFATRLVPIILGLSRQGPPAPAGVFSSQ
jgi:hypothetical protein